MTNAATATELFERVHVDLNPEHRPPSALRLLVATVVSIVGSLVADAALVAMGTRVFPSTKGYTHFVFSDYAKLTVVGVVIACLAWPVVTRISSAPRWLFLRLAVVVTIVLLLPDVYILLQGQSAEAVAVLVLMHLAIAVITYNTLVRIAPHAHPSVTAGPGHDQARCSATDTVFWTPAELRSTKWSTF